MCIVWIRLLGTKRPVGIGTHSGDAQQFGSIQRANQYALQAPHRVSKSDEMRKEGEQTHDDIHCAKERCR